jgi:8-amino-7-oxononanoate synthase
LRLHEELEERLAELLRKETALVFTTGYQTNLGVLSALGQRGDHIFLDRLSHACLMDGARLSLAAWHRFPHRDVEALARQMDGVHGGGERFVVTDGVFSMEGTIADLPGLVEVAHSRGAVLLVDDAHALGVIGPDGSGTPRHFGLEDQVDLVTATFSKSLGSIGGVVAGPEPIIHYLRHHARPLIFSASMPPASVAGVLAALDVMAEEPERRDRLWATTRRLAHGLEEQGLKLGSMESPIIPLMVGDFWGVLHLWRELFDRGVFAHAVIPPAVPPGTARIRISLTAEHTDEHVDEILEVFSTVRVGVPG